MYHKVKRGLDLGSGITCIVMGILEVIGAIVAIVATIAVLQQIPADYEASEYYNSLILLAVGMFIGVVIGLALAVCFVIFGAKFCTSPYDKEGNIKDRTKLNVGIVVCLGIYMVFAIVCFCFELSSAFTVIAFIMSFLALGAKIASMCLNGDGTQTVTAQPRQAKTLSLEGKISELKHLKELYVITDEQYKNAVQKIIEEYAGL